MLDKDWIRKVLVFPLMLPAYAHAIVQQIRERIHHATRVRPGDPSKRSTCCGPLPEEFKLGVALSNLPELNKKLLHVSTINFGYTKCFACAICGQLWLEDQVPVGHGELPRVFKAT